jgi:hypothetical protein
VTPRLELARDPAQTVASFARSLDALSASGTAMQFEPCKILALNL